MDINGAARTGDIGRVRELLDRGIDPNIRNHYDWTALINAFYHIQKI